MTPRRYLYEGNIMTPEMKILTEKYAKDCGNVFDEIDNSYKEINRKLTRLFAISTVSIFMTLILVVSNLK